MKRVISCVIIFAILFCILPTAVFAQSQCTCGTTPVVYVNGKTTIYADPANPDKNLLDVDDEFVTQAAKKVLPALALGLATGNFDKYCDELYTAVASFYENYALSDDGTVENGSGPSWSWSAETMQDLHQNGDIFAYRYYYDARTDPWIVAEDLNNYIQTVKQVTGHDKVCLISRCVGTAFASAYLTRYALPNDYKDLETCIFYNATVNGVSLVGELYSGQAEFEPKNIDRYAGDALGDDYLLRLVKATVSLARLNYTLYPVTGWLTLVYNAVADNVVPRILRSSYGTMPGYWSMVDDENYAEAKNFIFGDDTQRYAALIEKIDRFHYTVQTQMPVLLQDMKENGVHLAFLCKYGFQTIPIVPSADKIGDNTIELEKQSFGATCATINQTLSDDYINSRQSLGLGDYISPDLQVDASTCMFPDNTWFLKDSNHDDFPSCMNALLWKISKSENQMTVFDDPAFPQYLLYIDDDGDQYGENGRYEPLTEENCETRSYWNIGIHQAIIKFFRELINTLKILLGLAEE